MRGFYLGLLDKFLNLGGLVICLYLIREFFMMNSNEFRFFIFRLCFILFVGLLLDRRS